MIHVVTRILLASLMIWMSCRVAAEDLIITAAFHADLEGAPNGVELYVINDIPNLSIYGLGTADNGTGTDGQEYTFPNTSVSQGTYIYVVSKVDNFSIFFGFNPTYIDSDMKANGNDAYELFKNGEAIDRYGDPNVSGRNQIWEYYYGWAYRLSDNCPTPDFDTSQWYISGRDMLKDETSNATAAYPIPVKTFTVSDPASCTPLVDEDTSDNTVEEEPAEPQEVVISAIQGSPDSYLTAGTAQDVSPMVDERVAVEATVVGDFQDDDSDTQRNLGGFFLQEESADHDDDDESSEGIFVENSSFDVGLWDRVRVVGTVAEVNGETRIVDVTEVTTLEENDELDSDFTPGTLSLDSVSSLRVNAAGNNEPDLEALEGMLVNIPADLALALKDQSNLKLLNEVTLTVGERPVAFTEQNSPDAEAYSAYLDSVYLKQIFYDDGENEGYAEIGRLAGFAGYSDASAPRLGDVTTTSSIAVLDYKISGAATFDPAWRLRAPDSGSGNSIAYTTTELGTSPNPRPAGPGSVGGDITLMTMNLNHWFKTLNGNGNTTALGLEPLGAPVLDETTFAVAQDEAYNRQLTKLTLAIKESNADLMVLTGVENDFDNTADASTAIEVLVEEVNAELGEERYSYLYPGQQFVGSGADTVAIVYDSSVVGIANGSSIAILDDAVLATLADFALHDFENDPVFGGADNNRAALAATFSNLANNDLFTVVATQWMGRSDSSVSAATGTNIDQGDGAEYWNARREQAAEALISWIETNPTGIDEADITLMGSLNAYASEQPVTALLDYGFERASSDYNSVRSGFTGSLDYLLFNEAFAQKRISSDVWHINADEAPALGYQIDSPYETSYFDETTATRFAENDPILAGMVMAIPPQANAGDDLVVNEGETVTLSGLASVAGDYEIASWAWQQLTGDNIVISDDGTGTLTFTAPEVVAQARFEFELTVLDTVGLNGKDQVVVTVNNLVNAPVANAGEDQTVEEESSVTLSASESYDYENEIVSYQWRQVAGTTVTLGTSSSVHASFTAPALDEDETLLFEVTVTDGEGFSRTDQVEVLVLDVPQPPVADAGEDQTVDETTRVTLSGEGSTDPDDNIYSYVWIQISGTSVELEQAAAIATFTAPQVTATEDLIFELKVKDASDLQARDRVTVTVRNLVNAPVASAGSNQTVNEGDVVLLTADESTDADQDIVSYRWLQLSGDTVNLENSQSSQAQFEAPEQASGSQSILVFELTLLDAYGLSSASEVSIKVIDVPKAPEIVLARSLVVVGVNSTVTLDASGTTDIDGDLESFQWEQTAGTSAELISGVTDASLVLKTPEVTETENLQFRITATDADGLSSQASVTVTVNPDISSTQSTAVATQSTDSSQQPVQETATIGCSMGGANAPFDPTLPLMALMAAAWIARKPWSGLSSDNAI